MYPRHLPRRRVEALPLTGGQLLLLYVFRGLAWLLLLTTSVSISPSKAHAVKQESIGKRSPNNKVPAPPARKSGVTQARRALLKQPSPPPIDPLEKRDLVTYRVRTGDKLPAVLNRISISPGEKEFWDPGIKPAVWIRALPARKGGPFFFPKPLMRGRVHTGPRQ